MRAVLLIFAAALVAACDVNQELPITVVVYPSEKRCAVKQEEKETPVDCAQLGAYLRDSLKVSSKRQVDVSTSASENVPKEDQSIDRIAEVIRAAGFTDVRVWRFGMQ